MGPLAAKIVIGLLVAIGIAVIGAAVLLWPSQREVDIPLPFQNTAGGAVTTEAGHVVSTGIDTCGSPSASKVLTAAPEPAASGGAQCVQALVAIDSGPNTGASTLLEFSPGPGQPDLAAGEHIRVSRQVDQGGATSYAFYDYERTWPLIGLAAVFAVVIVAVARWRGLRALVGIVVAFVVLVVFLLPALRDGSAAIPVALVASAAILYAVIYLAHGVSLRTSAALLGTLTSLLLAAALSWGAIELAHLTGLSEDQNTEVAAYMGQSVDHRPAAGRVHHRLARRPQRRHGHAGVDSLRTGRTGRRAAGDLPQRHARGKGPHRQHRLHPGAGLRRQRVAVAAAIQRGQPVPERRADQRERGHRDSPLHGRWYRTGAVGAADNGDRRGAGCPS